MGSHGDSGVVMISEGVWRQTAEGGDTTLLLWIHMASCAIWASSLLCHA